MTRRIQLQPNCYKHVAWRGFDIKLYIVKFDSMTIPCILFLYYFSLHQIVSLLSSFLISVFSVIPKCSGLDQRKHMHIKPFQWECNQTFTRSSKPLPRLFRLHGSITAFSTIGASTSLPKIVHGFRFLLQFLQTHRHRIPSPTGITRLLWVFGDDPLSSSPFYNLFSLWCEAVIAVVAGDYDGEEKLWSRGLEIYWSCLGFSKRSQCSLNYYVGV